MRKYEHSNLENLIREAQYRASHLSVPGNAEILSDVSQEIARRVSSKQESGITGLAVELIETGTRYTRENRAYPENTDGRV